MAIVRHYVHPGVMIRVGLCDLCDLCGLRCVTWRKPDTYRDRARYCVACIGKRVRVRCGLAS